MKPPDRSGGFLFAGAVRPDFSANDARVLPGPGRQISKQLATVIDVAVQRHHLGGLLKEPFHVRSKGPRLKKNRLMQAPLAQRQCSPYVRA
jgi:hypothetical protein